MDGLRLRERQPAGKAGGGAIVNTVTGSPMELDTLLERSSTAAVMNQGLSPAISTGGRWGPG